MTQTQEHLSLQSFIDKKLQYIHKNLLLFVAISNITDRNSSFLLKYYKIYIQLLNHLQSVLRQTALTVHFLISTLESSNKSQSLIFQKTIWFSITRYPWNNLHRKRVPIQYDKFTILSVNTYEENLTHSTKLFSNNEDFQ